MAPLPFRFFHFSPKLIWKKIGDDATEQSVFREIWSKGRKLLNHAKITIKIFISENVSKIYFLEPATYDKHLASNIRYE